MYLIAHARPPSPSWRCTALNIPNSRCVVFLIPQTRHYRDNRGTRSRVTSAVVTNLCHCTIHIPYLVIYCSADKQAAQAMNRRVSGGQQPQQNLNPGNPAHSPVNGARLDLASLFPGAGPSVNLPQDAERHQRPTNGPNPEDPYYNARLMQSFPVPGQRPRQSRDEAAAAAALGLSQNVQQGMNLQMPRQGMPGSSMQRSLSATGQAPMPVPEDDPVQPFLEGLSAAVNDPTQRAMWTELIKLKTKALELQIADARARERTAEVTLIKLQQGVRSINNSRHSPSGMAAAANAAGNNLQVGGQFNQHQAANFGSFPLVTHARSPVVDGSAQQGFSEMVPNVAMPPPGQPSQQAQQPQGPLPPQQQGQFGNDGPMMTPFDLEAMLQGANGGLDNLFSWLPDSGAAGANAGANAGEIPQTAAPADLLVGGELMMPVASSTTDSGPTPIAPTSPTVKRPHSPESDESPAAPPQKKGKVRGEKKLVIEQHACCVQCNKTIARVLIRAPKSAIPSPINVEFKCPDCSGVHQPPTFDPHSSMGSGPAMGSTETRKRMRTAMEDDDMLNDDPTRRRCFCDVCQRVVCVGQVVGGAERQPLGNMTEIVCASCDSKYQR